MGLRAQVCPWLFTNLGWTSHAVRTKGAARQPGWGWTQRGSESSGRVRAKGHTQWGTSEAVGVVPLRGAGNGQTHSHWTGGLGACLFSLVTVGLGSAVRVINAWPGAAWEDSWGPSRQVRGARLGRGAWGLI